MKILQHIRAFVSGMMGVHHEGLPRLAPMTVQELAHIDALMSIAFPPEKPQPAKRKRTRKAVKK